MHRQEVRRRLVQVGLGVVASVAVAACGGGSGTSQSSTVGAPTVTTIPVDDPADQGTGFRNIRDFQVIDEQRGWIWHGSTVSMTDDGGRTWRDLASPSGTDGALFFFDSSRGVAAANDLPAGRVTLWFTSDGGRTFAPGTSFRDSPVVELDGDVASDGQYWLLAQFQSGSSFNFGGLLNSKDGASWERLAQPPSGGMVRFTDSRNGVILGGPAYDQVWATQDGGSTWSEIDLLSTPPDFTTGPPVMIKAAGAVLIGTAKGLGGGAFRDTILSIKGSNAVKVAEATSSIRDHVLTLTPSGKLVVYGADPAGARVAVALDPTGQKPPVPAVGLGDGVTIIKFVSDNVGWARRSYAVCGAGQTTKCPATDEVRITRDGGRTWSVAGAK